MKRARTRVKVAIASALAISSTAAVIYAAPEIMKAATYRASEEAVYLDVEKLTSNTVKVSLDNIQPGDLLFYSSLGHVGMYIGDNQWIESSYTGDYVRISNVPWSYVSRARRVLN